MTREEIAAGLDYAVEHLESYKQPYVAKDVRIAAAELRKTCATCAEWNDGDVFSTCPMAEDRLDDLPEDGTGFCSFWEAKP